MKPITAFMAGMMTCALIGAMIYFFWNQQKPVRVHKLASPLVLESNEETNGFSMLPKGTVLYFDRAYPEGFTRYKVYVNIDRMPLKLEALADPTSIDPLEASAPDKETLKKLPRECEYPLTKNDLDAMLKSGKFSRDEVTEVLEDFLRRQPPAPAQK
jgi:hypothetical protein